MLKSIFTRTTTRRARRRLTRNPGLVGGRPIAATPGKWEISRDMMQVQDRSAIGVEEYIENIYTIKHRGDWGREAPKISCT